MEGWNEEAWGMEDVLQIMNEIQNAKYEIQNCVRGAETGCHTYEELAEHLRWLGQRLGETAHALDFCDDEGNYLDPDGDEENEDGE